MNTTTGRLGTVFAAALALTALGAGTAGAQGVASTLVFGPGSLRTTDNTGWGGYAFLAYPVTFDGRRGPITLEIRGLNLCAVRYTGDMGWPPDPSDTGAVVGFGLRGSGSVRYQVLSNMAGGRGLWDEQATKRYVNDSHPGFRSYLFQGWTGSTGPFGSHQFNAERWGGDFNPEYDTVDIRFTIDAGKVSAWVRLHASWSWDDGNVTSDWGCPWNPAVNNAAPGTQEKIWNGKCIDPGPGATGRVDGAWLPVFDGPWTTKADLSRVQPYVFIQNWAHARGPYPVAWDRLTAVGVRRTP